MSRQKLILRSKLILFGSVALLALSSTLVQGQPTGLVSQWSAEGNADDSVDGNNAILHGAVGFVPGIQEQAFSFDGATYASVASAANLNPTGSFTMAAWVFPTSAGFGPIMTKWGDVAPWSNERAYLLTVNANQSIDFGISSSGTQNDGNFQHMFSPASVVNLNNWNHIAAVYDQSSGTRRIYVNGLQVATRTDAPITITNSIADLTIGAWGQSPNTANSSRGFPFMSFARVFGLTLSCLLVMWSLKVVMNVNLKRKLPYPMQFTRVQQLMMMVNCVVVRFVMPDLCLFI